MSKTRTVVSWEKFVETYMGSESSQEVAKKLGISLPTVLSKRKRLDDEGLKLKNFARKSDKPDVAKLKALVARLGGVDGAAKKKK